ncbi:MAG: alpha-amylase family protein [Treponema sp.]|nr:alpha-amylase family protein [Treponema sp.]
MSPEFQKRFESFMPELTSRLFKLYGGRWDFYRILDKLADILQKAGKEYQEPDADCDTEWYLSEQQAGYVLYVDLFAENFDGLIKKIPYLQELGITYVHLMPLFKCPEKESDGGYAVSSYRETDPKLGTISDLKTALKEFHRAGIRVVADFVFNHTSDEHEWALKAKQGNQFYRDFYFIYKDKSDADDWNRTLREIFPEVRRGSFTYVKEAGGWVWTTFNPFQWDLNYSNPDVFLAMCAEMLSLANLGVDVLRLDALAFIWKKKNTCCENLPEAHTLIQAFQNAARIAAPGLVFKSEAIVHPDEVARYISREECRLSYNPLQMALFWEALAARDTRLLQSSLKKRWAIPGGCAWVNYIRCHDDIGWTFSDEDAGELGINGYSHRQFLNKFYTNRFDGSFARGVPFQLNPQTGDCRICGTTASLAGLEDAYELHKKQDPRAELYAEMAVKRIVMIYTVLAALPGIPLIYSGDENAMINDYSYRADKSRKDDSRWVHRIPFNKTAESDSWLSARQEKITAAIHKIIRGRKNEKLFGQAGIYFHNLQDSHVFGFTRFSDHERIHIAANFSEQSCLYQIGDTTLHLGPYDVITLKESI